MNLIKRKIEFKEAKYLVEKIKLTPNIMGYSMDEWIKSNNVYVVEDVHGNIMGACLSSDISHDWISIAALFVFPEFRGQGFGKSLLYASINDALSNNKKIYITTANPIIISIIDKFNFVSFDSLTKLFINVPNKLYFFFYYIKWISNEFRFREIIRKSMFLRSESKFIFAIKT